MAGEEAPLIEKKDKKERITGQWRQVLIAGTGFLADAYDLFVIDLAIACLNTIRPLHPLEKSLIAAATLTGAVVGQVAFGTLGDWFGRRSSFIWTCVLILVGAIASASCQWDFGPVSMATQLALSRFILGVGVGGEYPLAATITSENSTRQHRASLISAVFSMQGWGVLLSTVVMLSGLYAGIGLDLVWRLSLLFGALPTAIVIYFRTQMVETQAFREEMQKMGHVTWSEHVRHSTGIIKTHWRELIGTTMTWFLLDITFYGTGSFKTRIGSYIMTTDAVTPIGTLKHQASLATVLAAMAIPGYLLSIAFIDRIGPRRLQLLGFYCMALNFFIVSLLNEHLHPFLLVFLFGLTFLFSNFGPNTTTFVIPATCYPSVVRSTCHGLSAASGKIGAVVGASAFSPLDDAYGLNVVLFLCGCVCLLGASFTHVFTVYEENREGEAEEKRTADTSARGVVGEFGTMSRGGAP